MAYYKKKAVNFTKQEYAIIQEAVETGLASTEMDAIRQAVRLFGEIKGLSKVLQE